MTNDPNDPVPDVMDATLCGKIQLAKHGNADGRTEIWAWQQPGPPHEAIGRMLPGGREGGIFLASRVSVDLPEAARKTWMFYLELHLGARMVLECDMDLLPMEFGHKLAIAPCMMLFARVRGFHLVAGKTAPQGLELTLKLHGQWGPERELGDLIR